MVASYTGNLRITKQGDNDNPNTWGAVVNDQVIELFEEAVCGVQEVDITGSSDVNLASSAANGSTDSARHAVLYLTGTLGANINLIVPSVEKVYGIRTDYTGSFTVTVKPSGGSTGVELTNDDQVILFTNGTQIEVLASQLDGLIRTNNLSDLPSAATARTNLGLGDAATSSVATILGAAFPVGAVYLTATNTNPSTFLGFGTWTQIAQGRAVIGVGMGTDKNGITKTFDAGNNVDGEYQHTITEAQMPEHRHGILGGADLLVQTAGGSQAAYSASGGSYRYTSFRETELTGDGEAMPTLIPSFGLYIWQRTV